MKNKGIKVIGSLAKSLLNSAPIVGDVIDVFKNLKEDTTNQIFNGSYPAGSMDWGRLIGKTIVTVAIVYFLYVGYTSGAFTAEQAVDVLQGVQ